MVLRASSNRAHELKDAGFACCTHADGLACAGAGKLVRESGILFVTCGNECTQNCGKQQPMRKTAEEAARCARKSSHARTQVSR